MLITWDKVLFLIFDIVENTKHSILLLTSLCKIQKFFKNYFHNLCYCEILLIFYSCDLLLILHSCELNYCDMSTIHSHDLLLSLARLNSYLLALNQLNFSIKGEDNLKNLI